MTLRAAVWLYTGVPRRWVVNVGPARRYRRKRRIYERFSWDTRHATGLDKEFPTFEEAIKYAHLITRKEQG